MRWGVALLLWGIGGCASDPMRATREAWSAGDYVTARDLLHERIADDPSNAHLYGLELGMVYQALGEPAAAVRVLRRCRGRLDELRAGNYTDWLAGSLLDDRSRVWTGADYEHVLVRAMLAVADLMAGGGDAFAYALQVLAEQQRIIESFPAEGEPKRAYRLVAFGSYLRAIIGEGESRGREDARREYARVLELEPGNELARDGLARLEQGLGLAPGHGVVHVLAMVGRAPYRVEVYEHATRDALMIAQMIWSIVQNRPFVPNVVPLPIPALAFRTDNPERAAVYLEGEHVADTATITDIEACAQAEFDTMHPYSMARAVVRRLLKTVVVEVGKEWVESGGAEQRHPVRTDLLQVGLDLLGNLWAGSEGADLRCWQLLPARLQAARLELPAGDHEIAVRAVGAGGAVVGVEQRVRVRVFPGYNTYVLGLLPTVDGGAGLLTSRPGDGPASGRAAMGRAASGLAERGRAADGR